MKIARITYLFALCPALLVGMTSCGNTSEGLPGQALSYEEALEQTKKIAPEFNLRTSLAKSTDISLDISKFNIDGKVTLPGKEPTNIRFTLPAQDDLKLSLNNESGVVGALEIRERLNRDIPTTYNAGHGAPKFGGNFLYNALFNPFFTTYTLSYIHEIVHEVSDAGIVNEKFSLDGNTTYVSYSIPDLKTFTDMAEEYEFSTSSRLFTVFRGTDGSASLTLGFDGYGYLNHLALKANSNDIAIIGDSDTGEENFRGFADVNLTAKLKQNFYAEDEYRAYSASTYSSNEELTVRQPTLTEYDKMGLESRHLEGKYVQDAFKYYDTILPTYGADFVVEHKGKASNLNEIIINIDGVNYPITDFLEEGIDSKFSYSWTAKNATINDYVTESGRSIVNKEYVQAENTYYAKDGYTFLPSFDYNDSHDASLFDEMLEVKSSNGHVYSVVNHTSPAKTVISNFINTNYNYSLYGNRLLSINGAPFDHDFSTEFAALPIGYAHYDFRSMDTGVQPLYGVQTRSSFAEIDGSSHGILDIYGKPDAKGGYTSPEIKPAEGFVFSKKIVQQYPTDEAFEKFLLGDVQEGEPFPFFVVDQNSPFAGRFAGALSIKRNIDSATGELESFTFSLSKDFIDDAKTWSAVMSKNGEAPFRLMDFSNEQSFDSDQKNQLFIRSEIETTPTEDSSRQINFNIIGNGISHCYNGANNLEEGMINATVETVKTEKILKFADFTICADDGYIFNFTDIYQMMSFINPYFYDNFNYITQTSEGHEADTVKSILVEFAKISDDKKSVSFSINNVKEVDRRNNLLKILYSCFNNDDTGAHFQTSKIVFNAQDLVVSEDSNIMNFQEGEEPKPDPTKPIRIMNAVTGSDYTFIQILPDYTSYINKDMKIIFDF